MAVRSKNKALNLAIFCALVGTVLFAYLAPTMALDLAPPCLFSFFFNIQCIGCGITHAIIDCLHGDFLKAWHHNPASWLVFPLLCLLVFKQLQQHLLALT